MRGLVLLCGLGLLGQEAYPPPRFVDAGRAEKLRGAMGEVDRLFRSYAVMERVPGMAWGVVIDGELAHVGTHGVQDVKSRTPVTADTVFRIASMTKSFTALAVMKLRDEGKLSLEDPVAKWIPEFAAMAMPTRDSGPIRVRQLLSHAAGFPEDNPWGDQQLGARDAELTAWLRAGIPFSTAPGTRYEYSNYGFGLLGRIVEKAAGVEYEEYVRTRILGPLGMSATTFEAGKVNRERLAVGYRLRPDGSYGEEPALPHGAFGAMGGLLTSARDMGRYVAFHLAGWPPRDETDAGPVRRASVREMSQMWTRSNVTASFGAKEAGVSGYGYGLRITSDCRFEHMVGHGGGLPGYGSYMAWLPEHGVGIFAMGTLTYSGPSRVIRTAFEAMERTGGMAKREMPVSRDLAALREPLAALWKNWDDRAAGKVAAMNLLLDRPGAERRAEIERLKAEVGACGAPGPVRAENWMRGQFNLRCEKGTVGVFYTLAPTRPAGVQHLEYRVLGSAGEQMVAPTGAPAGVSCRE